MNMTGQMMTATFVLVRDAKAFYTQLTNEPAQWYADHIRQEGRTVTWTCTKDTEGNYFSDLLDTVGYYGSAPIGRKATLNGVKAPPSY